ncbi:hypothetical protein U1Q18_029642 [Sarracenia purpurea var. burkii]
MEFDQSSSHSYYSVLGVAPDCSGGDIRRAYHRLAMQWHPDKWTRMPSLLGEAKRKFQQIQEAYSVLSDQRKRALYDAGFYDSLEEDDEGFSDFLQEMMSLMNEVRTEGKNYSMEELQGMFMEMAKGFEQPEWGWPSYSSSFQKPSWESSQWGSGHPSTFYDVGNFNGAPWEMNSVGEGRSSSSHLHASSFGMYKTDPFCS